MTTILDPPVLTESRPRRFHWTVEAYHRASEAGVFGHDARLELVHGSVIETMPISPLHAQVADYLADCLRSVIFSRFKLREEKPIQTAFDGELIPDISVVVDDPERYRQQHPTAEDTALLVEVAVSSADYDLDEKALLYAQAGITDYWVALPERAQIVVHRDPSPTGYRSVAPLGTSDVISPLAASGTLLAVGELLGLTEQ